MNQPSIRSALAEHVCAYAEVTSSASRQWARQLARRIVMFAIVASLALLALVVGIFVAILSSWNTPYQWWVVGGILVACVLGIVAAVIGAVLALRTRIAPPWDILADEIATDLRGVPGQPAPIGDEAAVQRMQDSREQLRGLFAPSGSAGAAKIGLGVAAMVLTTLLKRRSRFSGLGVILPLGLAALRFWRRRK
jgi:protein-S-isoprenylcysteine O-methyltransferase Ste14